MFNMFIIPRKYVKIILPVWLCSAKNKKKALLPMETFTSQVTQIVELARN